MHLGRSCLAAVALPLGLHAQDGQQVRFEPPEDPCCLSGTLGIDVPTAYYARGFRYEDQGLIVQPYLELSWNLVAPDEGCVGGWDLAVGQWNSLHTGPTGTGGGAEAWYESDFYASLGTGFVEHWRASVTWAALALPNTAGRTGEELSLQIGFDDSALWNGFDGLQPTVLLLHELKGQSDAGTERGNYLQFGIEPSFALSPAHEPWQFSLALPVTFGMSLGDYYEHPITGADDAVGYLDVGAVLSTPLPFVPSRFGPWQASFGLHWLLLGDTTEAFNDGDGTQLIASFGISTSF